MGRFGMLKQSAKQGGGGKVQSFYMTDGLQMSVQEGSGMIDGWEAFLPFPALQIWMNQVDKGHG